MAKEYEPEDPMELVGVAVPESDSDQVLDALVQEYLLMGWPERAIMGLFRSPYYGATHRLYRHKGEAHVKERVRLLAEKWSQGWIRGGEPDA